MVARPGQFFRFKTVVQNRNCLLNFIQYIAPGLIRYFASPDRCDFRPAGSVVYKNPGFVYTTLPAGLESHRSGEAKYLHRDRWPGPSKPRPGAVHWRGEFRIPNCHEMALELVCGDDFWCNRDCKTSPVVLEGFGGQVWPKISRNPTCKLN